MIDMKKLNQILLTTATAFNNTVWKLDDNGNIVMKDGNPVYVTFDGREMTVGINKISELNAEAKAHREAKEAAEAKLKAFADIDPELARKAIDTVGKLDAKQLIDAGKVEELRSQMTAQFQPQIQEKDKAISELQNQINNMLVKSVFDSSEFIRNNLAVPRDMFEASFKNNFKVEEGKVVAYGKDGNRLLSKTRAGEYADAEEAFGLLVDSHPQKDVIVKANVGSGTGNNGGGGARGGSRTMNRSDFAKLSPTQQAEVAGKVGNGEMQLTD